MTIAKRQLNRREALLGAGVVGGGALAALMTAPVVAADEGATGHEGAWLLDVRPDAGTIAPHRVIALYTRGGGVTVASDNPPSSGSTGLGAWKRTGDNQFLETFLLFTFDASGQPTGILRIRALSTIDETGDHISGQAHIDFQPPGGTFFPAGTTHFAGSRIVALPL